MPFQPGESGNPDGRPKGAANKITSEAREAFAQIMEGQLGRVEDAFAQLYRESPLHYLQVFARLAPYFIPRQVAASLDLTSPEAVRAVAQNILEQLDEEGVVQVLRDPDFGDQAPVIAAVGPLQFDVFAYRLDSEFGAPTELSSAPYEAIRLTDAESAATLRATGGIRILQRGDGALVALFESVYRLRRLEADRPELTLKPILTTTGEGS
jgi:peptide subunit release factor RF-3